MGWVVENESTTKQSQSEIIIVYILPGAYEGRSVQLRTIAWNGI